MATFAVSFHINFNNQKSYSERYTSFMEQVRKCTRIWEETTSFCLCETNETLDAFERRLYLSLFDPAQDKMLVMDARVNSSIARGQISYPATLKALLPYVVVK